METTTIREPVSASKSKIKEMKTKLKRVDSYICLSCLLFDYSDFFLWADVWCDHRL